MDTEAGSQQRQPQHGRHRRVAGDTVAMPEPASPLDRRPAHARPVIPVQPRTEDPLSARGIVWPCEEPTEPLLPVADIAETDPVGLRKFDIGSVPASVTPPRTWRKAAWFSVCSSAAALIGVLVVAAALIGPTKLRTQIESFPGQWQVALPSVTPSATSRHGLPGDPVSVAQTGTAEPTATGRVPGSAVPAPPSASHGSTAAPKPTGTLPLPPITTVPGTPDVDPTKIVQQTQHFFAAIDTNVGEAYQLTTGALRAGGQAALEQRYAEVSAVRLQGITVDPGKSLTISTVLLTKKDGSTVTEQHVLRFSTDDLPLISDDSRKN
ncbi:hypothetical protein [Kutzneria albida]|uniref:Uncharacterized protein n=1 Tax=Kutzneria albida DSM 43870 TaxID=1449976 RepID=W5WJV3_9PSEU|nr:hypothetical protein [Kutzneria albida]AHI01489.1 hypothetical protein KALB_8131 [Kutzneria albida DSM 43870]